MAAATRSPANTYGSARGRSTRTSAERRRVAHGGGRLPGVGGHGVESGHGVPDENEQRVADEGDLGRRIRRHVAGDGPEDGEERQRRDDVERAGDADDREPQDPIAPRQQGQRQRHGQPDGERQQTERDVLEQIGADLAPLARDVAPLEEGLCRSHPTRL